MEINVDSLEFAQITIRDVNGHVETYDLNEELRINDYDLEKEISLQPSKYVYWTSILEKMRTGLEHANLVEETKKAELYESAREAIINTGVPKPTKDHIESWILKQEGYVLARQQVNAYESLVKKLAFIVKAFEQRHSMLVQMSALKRDQREYDRAVKNM